VERGLAVEEKTRPNARSFVIHCSSIILPFDFVWVGNRQRRKITQEIKRNHIPARLY
jgi:hypothetical protein